MTQRQTSMASNTQYQGGGMGKKHMPPLVAKPIITVTEFTPGNTPDQVRIHFYWLLSEYALDLRKPNLRKNLDLRKIVATTNHYRYWVHSRKHTRSGNYPFLLIIIWVFLKHFNFHLFFWIWKYWELRPMPAHFWHLLFQV